MRRSVLFWLILFIISSSVPTTVPAQAPKKWTSGELHEAIKRLNFLGSVLYVAAHPDDENTRLIAWLANDVKAQTAYLSLTRGDGGQNLIGPEIRELLGLIRTQELLAARRVDGGFQMFTRANDFGYSKHPDETLRIWNREEVLADVVWAIRRWQPDIIINRFNQESAGETHGHHTSSAILSNEAFDLAARKEVYPGQLKYVQLWQPKRLFFNTSWWFYGSQEAFEKADKSKMVSIDVGVYYPVKGKSNNEIAAESRSMHKCQGFGSTGTRGSEMEYLQLLKGDMPAGKTDLFEGINTTWSRVEGGAPIGVLLKEVEETFRYDAPSASVPKLLEAYRRIQALPDGYWKGVKMEELKTVIQGCLGLFAEAVANDYSATPGEEVELSLEAINRSPVRVALQSVTFLPQGIDTLLAQPLENNQRIQFRKKILLPKDMPFTNPYWLNKSWDLGMYTVEDQQLRGLPETPLSFKVRFSLLIEDIPMQLEREVVFKRNDPVDGEMYRPFEVIPPVFGSIAEKVYIFSDDRPQTVGVVVKSGKSKISGSVSLQHPEGWKVVPEKAWFDLNLKGEEKTILFEIYPPQKQSEGKLIPIMEVNGETYRKEMILIEYDHIPTQTVLLEPDNKVVKVDIKKAGEKIAYIMGAGDEIPASLEQIGYSVTLLEDRDITLENLRSYDALILGVRAYNTVDRLKYHQPTLMEYVKSGGTMIVQYNTNSRLVVPREDLGPYPIRLSRDRVTVEEAEVRFLKPEHPVLNHPNKITSKDFEGWVQERGLYFPDQWDEQYEAVLSCNDPGESPKDGGLLVAGYGEGYYIYTGYSWFRELPSGVPGAFRLFANLISIGKEPKP